MPSRHPEQGGLSICDLVTSIAAGGGNNRGVIDGRGGGFFCVFAGGWRA